LTKSHGAKQGPDCRPLLQFRPALSLNGCVAIGALGVRTLTGQRPI
jgi:hypothetical protein